jgi:uncharacterized protein YndB with AHSA1/START domain
VSEIRIVRDYAYPIATVWRALTDPDLVPLWTATGAVLAELDADGHLRPDSTLRARS